MKEISITVFGLVQGVFFRKSTVEKATELNITGWVRNRKEGFVEILAQGSEEELVELLDWSYKGSILARVQRVEVQWTEAKESYSNFSILSTK